MMKTKEDIQLELLEEIDDICSKNDLKYILFGINSLNAYLHHRIDEISSVSVAMTQGDIDRFCSIVESQHGENRYVEGLFNNPKFNSFHVNYGNRNTTDFHIIGINKNKHFGICIRIYPICKAAQLDGKPISALNKRLAKERKFRKLLNKRIENNRFWYIKTGLKVLDGLYSLTGGGKRYYNEVKKNTFIDRWEDIQNYSKVRIGKKQIPSQILKEIARIDVGGIGLCIPENHDAYFAELFDKNYREMDIKVNPPEERSIVDTEIGYEQILEETKDILHEARAAHEEIVWQRKKVRHENQTVLNIWHLVEMTDIQIAYIEYFTDKIDYLLTLDLNDKEEFEIVYGELKPVIDDLKKYAAYGMTFSIDSKTDDLIEKVLVMQGKEGLAKRLKQIAQKRYFVE